MAIDHWYHLNAQEFSYNQQGCETEVYGPFGRDGLLVKLAALLGGPVEDPNFLPVSATVVKVGLVDGVEYQRHTGGWREAGFASGIAQIPENTTAPGRFQLAAWGTLQGRINRAEKLVALISQASDGRSWVEHLSCDKDQCLQLLEHPGELRRTNKLFLFDLTLAPEVVAGVDLVEVSKRIRAAVQRPAVEGTPGGPEEVSLSNQIRPADLQDGGPGLQRKEPVAGFRTWRLHVPSLIVDQAVIDAEPHLLGPNYDMNNVPEFEWQGAEISAECLLQRHQAPAFDCGCGIYAHNDFGSTDHLFSYNHHDAVGANIRGLVLGTGEVMVHEEGWRAESVRIVAFDSEVDPRYLPALQHLSQKLDVPIVSRARLLELAEKKGQLLKKSDLEGPL